MGSPPCFAQSDPVVLAAAATADRAATVIHTPPWAPRKPVEGPVAARRRCRLRNSWRRWSPLRPQRLVLGGASRGPGCRSAPGRSGTSRPQAVLAPTERGRSARPLLHAAHERPEGRRSGLHRHPRRASAGELDSWPRSMSGRQAVLRRATSSVHPEPSNVIKILRLSRQVMAKKVTLQAARRHGVHRSSAYNSGTSQVRWEQSEHARRCGSSRSSRCSRRAGQNTA